MASLPAPSPSSYPASQPVQVGYAEIPLAAGDHEGTSRGPGGITLDTARGVREYCDPFAPAPVGTRYVHAAWTSPVVEPGFVFTELVPSWHARTPAASWLEIEARVRAPLTGQWSRWLTLARWADHDAVMHSTSVPGPPARSGQPVRADTDTLRAADGAQAWQTRITLLRAQDAGEPGPTVTYLGAMASTGPASGPLSEIGPGAGRALDLPAYSQRAHGGRHPQWGGGGDVWCSPTCVAMVLGYWNAGPDRDAMAWVDPSYPDRPVYHAVRHTWDYAYQGAGNWSFNVAYAARFGLRSLVTRLRDLTEAEAFIVAGIPLVASLRVDPQALDGAEYRSAGHLVVIAGFTDDGDVIVHDPASYDAGSVRRVYRRRQFEHAWQSGSGGIVYIIHTPTASLPQRSAEPNW